MRPDSDRQSAAKIRRFTMEGDPSTVFKIAEAHGFKITHPRWWQRTYAIPRWLCWFVGVQIALDGLRGLILVVRWIGG